MVQLWRRLVAQVVSLVRLVREGDADLDGTYPELRKASPEEMMLNGQVINGFVNPGSGVR